VATGRTSIDIRYWWPDGPVVARLYVDVRALRTINCRFHLVDVNGAGWGNQFLGQVRPPAMALAAHHTSRIAEIVEGVNHVFLPHGIAIVNSETVATAWHNGLFTAAADPAYWQIMHAMAHSPHRGPNRLNIFIADWPHARASASPPPFALDFVALGPPIAWATNISARWPNAPGGHVGSGIMVDANAIPFTGSILAHEFGHIFHLSVLTAAGAAKQWHTIGDNTASRDDMVTRRRLMYPYTSLANSNNSWRNDVGYGSDMGALLVQRRLGQDETFEESRRAYDHAIAAHVYAP
jgi:hypothetical protein